MDCDSDRTAGNRKECDGMACYKMVCDNTDSETMSGDRMDCDRTACDIMKCDVIDCDEVNSSASEGIHFSKTIVRIVTRGTLSVH